MTRSLDEFEPTEHYVVQRYLHKPFLIDNLKFDLRIYIMVAGVDPLRVFFYNEGLCRLATVEYKTPDSKNMDNLRMHLTNYAINKFSKDYIKGSDKDEVGHKRSLRFVWRMLDSLGYNSQQVIHNIKSTILKTLISVQPCLSHTYRSC